VTFKYKHMDLVNVNLGPNSISGIGRIKGVATTEMPVVGHIYIVDMIAFDNENVIPNETYPFDTISVPENHLSIFLNP